jgi:hypothetical protein
MNMKISVEFGAYFARIPLKATPHIVCANALQTDWASVLPPERCSYVLGNPPFLGKSNQSAAQKADMQLVCGDIKNAGLLDFVAAWYIKAARYMRSFPSPSQGEGQDGGAAMANASSTQLHSTPAPGLPLTGGATVLWVKHFLRSTAYYFSTLNS